MIGIFDSGAGGLAAYREARRLLPMANIIYLADRKNAPYGIKSKDDIIRIVKNNIKRLSLMGAKKILIACGTASSVYPELSEFEQEISIPIIDPAAKEAALIGGRCAVIATNHTVSSHAFAGALAKISPSHKVLEIAAQILVSLVEAGARDGALLPREEEIIDRLASRISDFEADSLILGCTHFSHLEGEFRKRLRGVRIINPAKLGAKLLSIEYKKADGRGINIFTA